jgi:hypothetical protein
MQFIPRESPNGEALNLRDETITLPLPHRVIVPPGAVPRNSHARNIPDPQGWSTHDRNRMLRFVNHPSRNDGHFACLAEAVGCDVAAGVCHRAGCTPASLTRQARAVLAA